MATENHKKRPQDVEDAWAALDDENAEALAVFEDPTRSRMREALIAITKVAREVAGTPNVFVTPREASKLARTLLSFLELVGPEPVQRLLQAELDRVYQASAARPGIEATLQRIPKRRTL